MTWGFSKEIGNSSCSSCAKLSRGESVPLVSSTQRTARPSSWRMATPGSKHQYDSVGTSSGMVPKPAWG